MAGRQHEPVAVGPVGCVGGVAQEARPEHVGHRRRAHRRARVAGVRLLDAVDRERSDRVDRELVQPLHRDFETLATRNRVSGWVIG